MLASDFLFYILGGLVLLFSLLVVATPNPLYSSLSLVISMIGLAAMFFVLEAYFIAGVQLIVYAGAVMVLFVMVLMLFDLRKEQVAFSPGLVRMMGVFLVTSGLFGFVFGAIRLAPQLQPAVQPSALKGAATRELAHLLFSKYIFAFEVLGVLLLLIAVGVVVVSRVKGGTHAES